MLYTVFGIDNDVVEELGTYFDRDEAYARAQRAMYGYEQWPWTEVRIESLDAWYK